METKFTELTQEQLEQINLGDMRGDLVVLVDKQVPFYHALCVLKNFDKNLETLHVESHRGNLYQVEMHENIIRVSRCLEEKEITLH